MDDPNTSVLPATPAKKKILIVEDDNNLALVYATRLKAEGFEIKHEPDGEKALATALSFQPDLILLDILMPKLNGLDTLDILRTTPQTSKAKIIMLTALSQDDNRTKAVALGADDYIVKSQVTISDVVDIIKKHLGIR